MFPELLSCAEKDHRDRAFLESARRRDLTDGAGVKVSLHKNDARFLVKRGKKGIERLAQSKAFAHFLTRRVGKTLRKLLKHKQSLAAALLRASRLKLVERNISCHRADIWLERVGLSGRNTVPKPQIGVVFDLLGVPLVAEKPQSDISAISAVFLRRLGYSRLRARKKQLNYSFVVQNPSPFLCLKGLSS